ncbi:MAG: hypothetical protein U1C57_03920 [Candidatus Doudnabacteria bacterium]|nr:hypothetical protein [Desulfobacterales bacterium]MDZ4244224.1 hypothetical protein [Candidatus Doudnabacteria bacterium]
MKQCKTCGKMRAKSAKSCPHCGAVVNHNLEFVLKIVVAIVAFNIFMAGYMRYM